VLEGHYTLSKIARGYHGILQNLKNGA